MDGHPAPGRAEHRAFAGPPARDPQRSRRPAIGLWLIAAGALASPFVDGYLTQTQPRFVVFHGPAWLLLGYVAGRHFILAPRPHAWNPLGLTGLVFFVGSVAFWMIPRTVDAAVLSWWVDELLHVNLVAAGFLLGWSVPAMPFVLKAASGIYAASMTFALGALYTHYSGLLCGTFTLLQQRQTGHRLYVLSSLIVVAVFAGGLRGLARQKSLSGNS